MAEDAHVTIGPGAGHYLSQRGDTGSGGRRASVSDRHRDGIHAGYPNSLVPPVDTHGCVLMSLRGDVILFIGM